MSLHPHLPFLRSIEPDFAWICTFKVTVGVSALTAKKRLEVPPTAALR
jgi:hypothetical protein